MSRTLWLLLCLPFAAACPAEEEVPPAVPELDDGWTEIEGGVGTSCARGDRFAFYVHPGTVNKVVVDFMGGGACWDQTTCSIADAIFTDTIDWIADAVADNETFSGIYDKTQPDNPVADWYHVVIPYCTGDLHWGNNIETYGTGGTSFAINHVGATNTQFVLDWVYENFTGPDEFLVTGCSAGSYGAALWSASVADHYPESQVTQFGDSGAGIITDQFFRDSFPSWNAEEAFPFWISSLNPDETDIYSMNLADLYTEIATAVPTMHLSQFNTTYDRTQVRYFEAMGGGGALEWSSQMIAMVDDIEARASNFCSYRGQGNQHCILGNENLYTFDADGTLFVDWLADLLGGNAPAPIACTDCGEP
jgi:hypothetical protein